MAQGACVTARSYCLDAGLVSVLLSAFAPESDFLSEPFPFFESPEEPFDGELPFLCA
jgi:hypothetical protein